MSNHQDSQSNLRRNAARDREQIDGFLASTPAFWIIGGIVLAVVVTAIIGTFL